MTGFVAARVGFVLTVAALLWVVIDCPVSFWLGTS